MPKSKYTGKYTDAFLTEDVSNYNSNLGENFNKYLTIKENEAVYVYRFKENKMLFAKGFENVLNKKNDEINMKILNTEYDELSKSFVSEYHDRALLYLYNHNSKLKSFSSSIVVKSARVKDPLLVNIQVMNTDSKGNLVAIIGRIYKDKNLRYNEIIQYSLNGQFEGDFLFQMNHKLDFDSRISLREIKIIEGLKNQISHKEIGKNIGYPGHRISEVIQLLFKRFKVKSEEELIAFAENKELIPNQFSSYNPPVV